MVRLQPPVVPEQPGEVLSLELITRAILAGLGQGRSDPAVPPPPREP